MPKGGGGGSKGGGGGGGSKGGGGGGGSRGGGGSKGGGGGGGSKSGGHAAGKTYVMRDGNQYKIGQSTDPGRRAREVRQTHPGVQLQASYSANNPIRAEAVSHKAVQSQLGMKPKGGDWFTPRPGTSGRDVQNTVGAAVQSNNARN